MSTAYTNDCLLALLQVNMKFVVGALAALLLIQACAAYSVSRITDGVDAAVGQFPHQVSLQWGIPILLPYSHVCGGTILNERWILTAGHCVTSVPKIGRTIVKVGKHHILQDDEHVQTVKIAKKIVHPNYPGNVAPNDIALLKLKTPLVFNERVQPAVLPVMGAVQTGEAVLSGWGSVSKKLIPKLPTVLQTATVPIVDNPTCAVSIKNIEATAELVDSMLCTGPITTKSISACSGDSGGPLVQYENEKTVVVGVVSWGFIPCGAGAPSVYTRVSSFTEWIESTINSN